MVLGQQARPSVRILYYSHVHGQHARKKSQMHEEDMCARTRHTHKQPSRVNEVLEFVKATPSQQQTLFYSSSHPSVRPLVSHLLTSILHVGALFLVATLHLTLHTEIRVRIQISSWRRAEAQSTKKRKRRKKKWQMDTVHLKHVSSGFIITDHRIAWCVGLGFGLGLHRAVCAWFSPICI